MSGKFRGLVLIFFITAAAAGFGLIRKSVPNPVPEEETKWSELADRIGTPQAYEEFKKQYAAKSFIDQHLTAHEFGQLIYRKLGVSGASVCDSSFGFGCYHGFFGLALATSGEKIIAELDRQCVAKFGELGTGCQHGIGHGLVEYYGPERLAAALAGCKSTTQKNPLFGCTSGVFMEYNLPTLIGENTAESSSRQFAAAQPYGPCRDIAGDFHLSCFYELPQWWLSSMDAARAEQLCAAVKQRDDREVCFLGLGNYLAGLKHFEIQETISACGQLPDAGAKTFCLAGAAWAFFSMPEKRSFSAGLCSSLSAGDQKICLAKSRIICNYLDAGPAKEQCLQEKI